MNHTSSLLPYKSNIIYSQNMLRKNNLEKARQDTRCTVGCQTEEFLLYLALEDKLQNVYKEYRQLQKKYVDAQKLVQCLQDQNKYLQTSLFDISITFNNKIANSNIKRIQEIRNLEARITKESKQLQVIHQNDCKNERRPQRSILQEEKGKPSSMVEEKSMQVDSCIKYKRISAQDNNNNEENEFSLGESNQFLPQATAALCEKKQTTDCQSDRYQDPHIMPLYDQSSTFRPTKQSKSSKSSSKKHHANKQNINYDKLAKIQAHLKLKQFMLKFQMDGQSYQQFPQSQEHPSFNLIGEANLSKLR